MKDRWVRLEFKSSNVLNCSVEDAGLGGHHISSQLYAKWYSLTKRMEIELITNELENSPEKT